MMAAASTLFASEVDMKPTHIALFENGYGFVSMQGKLTADTNIRLNSLPVPTLGSFWIAAEQGVQVNRLVSGMLDYETPVEVNLLSLAAANPGAKVQVTYKRHVGEVTTVEGVLLPFPRANEYREGNTIDQISEAGKNPMLGNTLMLKVADRTLAISSANIVDIAFTSDIKMPTRSQRRPGVELELAAPAAGKLIEATSLSSGITWQPSYRIELGEDGKASLTAKATITNNLMDMEKIQLELVLGSPSLEYIGSIDPMALRGAPQSRMARNAAPKMQSVAFESAPVSVAVVGGAVAEAVNTGNLYFYPINAFSAKAGQVITQPLFGTTMPYKDIYTWTLEDPRDFPDNLHDDIPDSGEVWSCVRFTNPLDIPLTDAPVEFIKKDRIAGNNELSFTPAKGECTAPIMRAVNVTTMKKNKITKQEAVRLSFSKGARTKNSCEVTLTINNGMDEAIDMEIMQNVNGKILNVGQGGTFKSTPRRGYQLNGTDNVIRWNLKLEKGEKKELTFSYEYIN